MGFANMSVIGRARIRRRAGSRVGLAVESKSLLFALAYLRDHEA